MTDSALRSALTAPLTEALHGAAEETAALLRPGADVTARIPGAEWNVGEAAAHLALANAFMAALARGEEHSYGDGTPGGLAAANEDSLKAYPERDPAVLAGEITRHTRAFTEAAAQRAPGDPVLTPMGPMDMRTFGSYLLTHIMGHGYDIAAALRRPHMVDGKRVELTLPFFANAMPRVVHPSAAGLTARYRMKLWGGTGFTVVFTDGVPDVRLQSAGAGADAAGTGPVDCTISGHPVEFFLLALGRRRIRSVMGRGKVFAWGRKPWLAAGFPGLFVAP
ncbi:maleylpyruvate isomerase family mycothiol-dependent enzyme [Streptomyces meridianus]|uniref:Maleylpyruvate isomerase family mycothiol-dependent enzyme n=1 Tax=Streptomyces meridianus TaxID=2938945 RepID=A0ABT0X9W9_9ACTN|nr:maleylpyruvate isomerase family mycothiol-dependent enzyme [Streptomyces meridianus]MCM2579327.1 maleylpyruvate isomerase family mycothiol-dependent enzyme [Streptomyces meridianus]